MPAVSSLGDHHEVVALPGRDLEFGERFQTFGHRIHTADPRTPRIFELAEAAGIDMAPIELIKNIADELEKQSGRALPINVDGAMAAVLVSLGIDPKMSNAFFIMARVPGMVAHIEEEWQRQRPMRRIHPTDHEYDVHGRRTQT